MKVANIILEGRFGGPQNRILQVADHLRRYGIETVVVMPDRDSDKFYQNLTGRQIMVRKMELHRLTRSKHGLIKWLISFFPEVMALRKVLKEERVDLVHCNSAMQIKDVLAGKLAGARVAWHLNDSCAPVALRIIFQLIAPLADGFIVTGKRVRQYYFPNGNCRYTQKIAEIQPPVDFSYFNFEKTVPDRVISAAPGLKIVTVGNITPTKGIEYFIEMAYLLTKKYQNLSFYIVGPHLSNHQKFSDGLRRLVDKLRLTNVHFYGNSDDVASVLKAADIFVCPSITESGPTVVWEAMAMGKAVVSTDVGDVTVYIKDNKNGFVIPSKNAAALAEKTGILIENKDLRGSFGTIARSIAMANFDISMVADKHRAFYMEITGKNE